MDCIAAAEAEQSRLNGRPVSAAFYLAVVERALVFISGHLPSGTVAQSPELREACDEALEAAALLRSALSRLR